MVAGESVGYCAVRRNIIGDRTDAAEDVMGQDKLNGSADLLAKAMRRVFDEEVQSHPDSEQDADDLPERRPLDQQGSEALDRI